MTRDEWQRIKRIAVDALARPASERAEFIAAECGSDDRLHDEIKSLLASTEEAGALFETPMFDFATITEILAQAGDTDEALNWLDQACNEHDFMVMYIRVAPNLDPLRAEPRFQKLLQRSCRM